MLIYGCEHAFESIATGDAEGLVGRISDSLAIRATEVGGCEACGVNVKDLKVVDCAAIISLADNGKSAEVVEKSQSIGCEVYGTANGRWYGADLEDLDSGDLSFRCVFGECKGGGEACDAATEDDDVQAVWRCGCHDCLLREIEKERERKR